MDEEMTFVPREQVLTLEELLQIADAFVSLGVKKIRLTGGEPLIRTNVTKLCRDIANLDGLDELVMTSNGSQLPRLAGDLKEAGLKRLNISLDSLKPERFKQLTRTGDVAQVLSGIDAAKAAGFDKIKLNAVILRGRNDDEIEDLVAFAIAKQLDISFIEEMPLGVISEHSRAESFMSNEDVLARLQQTWTLSEVAGRATDGPSRYHSIAETQTRVGFISPHSHNFCGDCNRVRLTAEGRLLLCLGHEHSVDLRAVVRANPGEQAPLVQAIVNAMDLKPERHFFDHSNEPDIVRFMSMTGG